MAVVDACESQQSSFECLYVVGAASSGKIIALDALNRLSHRIHKTVEGYQIQRRCVPATQALSTIRTILEALHIKGPAGA